MIGVLKDPEGQRWGDLEVKVLNQIKCANGRFIELETELVAGNGGFHNKAYVKPHYAIFKSGEMLLQDIQIVRPEIHTELLVPVGAMLKIIARQAD